MIRVLILFGLWFLWLAPAFACGLGVFPPVPPGVAPRLVETPLCGYFQNSVCEFRFGPDRLLRVPADLLHPGGVSRAHAPTGDYEVGLVRTTWGRLRAVAGQTGPTPGDEATVRVLFQSDRRLEVGSLESKLRVFAPEQLPAVTAARARGGATIAFADRDGDQWEVVFRDGCVATERECNRNACGVLLVRDGVFLKFHYDRRINPTTEEAVALVAVLLNTFVVEGPKLRQGE